MRNGYRISDYENANASDGAAETPVHGNAWVGNHRAVRRLLRKGWSVNVLDSTGESPLHGACASGRATVVSVLLANGADPNIQAMDTGNTPLHWACGWDGALGIVRSLLKAGASQDLTNASGEKPIDIARRFGRGKIVDLLDRPVKDWEAKDWDTQKS